MVKPKNVLDYPNLPEKASLSQQFLAWFSYRKVLIFTFLLAISVIILSVLEEDINKIDTFIGIILYEFIGLPCICGLVVGIISLVSFFLSYLHIEFFDKKKRNQIARIGLWLYNALNLIVFFGILYDLWRK